MSQENLFNPEPPLEIAQIQKEDLIGDTMFSKHWLFMLLLKLIKVSFVVVVKSRRSNPFPLNKYFIEENRRRRVG